MKFVDPRPFANPEVAARKLMEIANSVEPVQDGRIHIELINGPFLYELRGSPVARALCLHLRRCRRAMPNLLHTARRRGSETSN